MFRRTDDNGQVMLILCNFTPVPREAYRVGVPKPGRWAEVLNTDAAIYGGANIGNGGSLWTEDVPAHGHDLSLSVVLPPLSTLFLRWSPEA
jgi:1,4-alpha-glucan branching enzyme